MAHADWKRFFTKFKWRHAGVIALILLFALLALLFSGRVSGTLPLLGPSSHSVNDITYMSGGISESEATLMKALANDYPLEVVFIRKLDKREEYLADIRVKVIDHHMNDLLDIQTDGPYLLADMPSGKYLIAAEYEGVIKQQWFHLVAGKHLKLVFWWPISESDETESSEAVMPDSDITEPEGNVSGRDERDI